MKKKIIIVMAILVILVTLICIPKTTYQKWFGKNEQQITNSNKEYLTVYVCDDENQLVGVKVYVDKISDDVIKQKWDLLTSNIDLLPSGYSSTICPTTTLNKYEINENKLFLDVSEEINKSQGRLTIESIAWTFCDDQIEEVVLKNNEETIKKINDCSFNKISKKIGTNFTYETSYLFEADFVTLVYYKDDLIKPVTYFYKDSNECDFMITKLFDFNEMEVQNYQYELSNDKLTITVEDTYYLSEDFKKSFVETLKLNTDVEHLMVSNVDKTIFEQTFAKVN